jgi:hypothetical protein
MKIDPNLAIGSAAGVQVRQKNSLTGGFEDVLKGMETSAAQKSGAAGSPLSFGSINPQKLNALSTSEEALDLLERYSQAVSNPGVNLKSLEPMVNELEVMREKVQQASSFIGDNDPLKGIMNEVGSALYGEVLRFKRGELIG